jgi:hypothetical protein
LLNNFASLEHLAGIREVPLLSVTLQNLAADATEFCAVFLQTGENGAVARPGHGMAKPAHVRAARSLFLRGAAGRE